MRRTVLLLIIGLASAGEVSLAADSDGVWQRTIGQMFARDQPRRFARTPGDYFDYLRAGEGFYTQVAATSVYQQASSSLTDRDDLLNVAMDFGGALELLDRHDDRVSGFSWWIRGGRAMNAPRDADLSREIGAVQGVNASLESDAFQIKDFFWAHQPLAAARYSLGWISTEQRYDYSDAAASEREQFLADSLNNSPTIPFPNSGLGVNAFWTAAPALIVHGGLFQANCKDGGLCFDKLQSNEWFIPLELRFQPTLKGLGRGSYSLLGYYTETGGRRGGGVSLSIDQYFGRWVPFMRWSHGDADTTEFTDFVSLGLGVAEPFGHRHDEAGFGYARARPSDPQLDDETVVELYYRWQVSNYVSLTPDLMVVMNPAKNPDEDRVAVLGFRVQLDF